MAETSGPFLPSVRVFILHALSPQYLRPFYRVIGVNLGAPARQCSRRERSNDLKNVHSSVNVAQYFPNLRSILIPEISHRSPDRSPACRPFARGRQACSRPALVRLTLPISIRCHNVRWITAARPCALSLNLERIAAQVDLSDGFRFVRTYAGRGA